MAGLFLQRLPATSDRMPRRRRRWYNDRQGVRRFTDSGARENKMDETIAALVARIHDLEDELEHELRKGRDRFKYRIEGKRITFEAELRARHLRLKRGIVQFLRESGFLEVVTSPFIYSLILPLAMLDLFVFVYQQVCFRVYGIPIVRRDRYIIMDRQKLAYLNALEKLNCVYCGYATGVIALARDVAARTEQYWCPVKHARGARPPHERYRDFIEFGDAEGYREGLDEQRRKARED
jgi:hypothetical protein